MLLAEPARIRGDNYGALVPLVPLAPALQAHQCLRGETAIYRSLPQAILTRAYARSYGHAARCVARLREIAAKGIGLLPLESHEDFEGAIQSRHARNPHRCVAPRPSEPSSRPAGPKRRQPMPSCCNLARALPQRSPAPTASSLRGSSQQ
jgi:hypothetical protein